MKIKYYWCARCQTGHTENEICPVTVRDPSLRCWYDPSPPNCTCSVCRRTDIWGTQAYEDARRERERKAAESRRPQVQLTITQCDDCGLDTIFGSRCHWCQELADLRAAKPKPKPVRVGARPSVVGVLFRMFLSMFYLISACWLAIGGWAGLGVRTLMAVLLLGYSSYYVGRAATVMMDEEEKVRSGRPSPL